MLITYIIVHVPEHDFIHVSVQQFMEYELSSYCLQYIVYARCAKNYRQDACVYTCTEGNRALLRAIDKILRAILTIDQSEQ